jgi:hypothetical protein
MRERSVTRYLLLTCTAALTMAVSACASTKAETVVVLPNGYTLQPDKSPKNPGASVQSEIDKGNGHHVVPAPIAAYAVSGTVVAGALGEPPANSRLYTNDLPFSGKPDTRYFVLDTLTGKLDTNLDEAAWKKRLQELGVPGDFRIYPPLPW